ncbi:hypothetical protein HWV62_13884 [Athelia sp. TMB]|nr:hypothetical protein HWV62_14732 [Athelia sp. TMB]KAF7973939.1 hypothetical protein HWV62_13884 [Athelia sp. TMB]
MQHPHVSDTSIQSLTQTPKGAASGENAAGGRKRTSLKAALSQAYSRVTSTVSKTTGRQPNRPRAASKASKASIGEHPPPLVAPIHLSSNRFGHADSAASADSRPRPSEASDDHRRVSMQRQSTISSAGSGSREGKSRSVIVNEDLYEWWGPTDAVIFEGHRDDEVVAYPYEPVGHNTMKYVALLATT